MRVSYTIYIPLKYTDNLTATTAIARNSYTIGDTTTFSSVEYHALNETTSNFTTKQIDYAREENLSLEQRQEKIRQEAIELSRLFISQKALKPRGILRSESLEPHIEKTFLTKIRPRAPPKGEPHKCGAANGKICCTRNLFHWLSRD